METELRTRILPALAQGWRPYAILTFLCLLLYLPGLAEIPPLDRDESRFAQATVQMLETGDPLRIRYQETERNKKPGGAYWLQAASVGLLSSSDAKAMWAHRLPSTLAALASVLLTFFIGARFIGREAALVGSALLGSTVLLTLEAHQAKTDAILLLTIVAAQAALARIYIRSHDPGPVFPSERSWVVFWVAIGIGGLVKGPITAMVAGLTILVLIGWDRSFKWLAPLRAGKGLLIALALIAPWAIGIGIVTEGRFFIEAIGHDMLGKVAEGQENHGAWPGYYVALLPLMGWPLALVLVPGLVAAWKFRDEAVVRFLVAWALPTWIVFELVSTKLPHYVLPSYPALALLAGLALIRLPEILASWPARAVTCLSAFFAALLAIAGLVLPVLYGPGPMPLAVFAALIALMLLAYATRQAWTGRAIGAWVGGILAAAVLLPATFQGVIPRLEAFDVSGRVAEAVERFDGGRLAIAGYHEPSLVFRLGTETLLVNGPGAAQALVSGEAALAAVGSPYIAEFEAVLAKEGLSADVLRVIDGFNYSKGKPVSLSLYRLVP